jgi:hypothetical protein
MVSASGDGGFGFMVASSLPSYVVAERVRPGLSKVSEVRQHSDAVHCRSRDRTLLLLRGVRQCVVPRTTQTTPAARLATFVVSLVQLTVLVELANQGLQNPPMPDSKARVEKLLDALRDVTRKAEELAAEVTESLREDRRVGRPAPSDADTAENASKAARRRQRDRRKAQDDD